MTPADDQPEFPDTPLGRELDALFDQMMVQAPDVDAAVDACFERILRGTD